MSGPTGVLERPWGGLAYRRWGAGPPLVLLHSLALSSAMWAPVAAELGERFEVVAPDARGHGDSAWDGSAFSVEDLADDVRALLDALGLERAHVLGLSMGGTVALALAAEAPSSVDRLVVCDASAWYGENAREQWAERAARARSVPRHAQVAFQTDRWLSERFRREHPEVVSHLVGIFLRALPQAHAAACSALGSADRRGSLERIGSPTLVVVGEDDHATPPAMAMLLAESIPEATVRVWPGFRHFAIFESPGLRSEIVAHLEGRQAGEAAAAAGCCEPAAGAARGRR